MERGGGAQPTYLVTRDDPCPLLSFPALAKSSDWVDQFRVKFLGSVQVPYHKGNDVLCAAMQKVVSHPILLLLAAGQSLSGASSSLLTSPTALSASLFCRLPPRAASLCTLTHPPAASWRSVCAGSRLL